MKLFCHAAAAALAMSAGLAIARTDAVIVPGSVPTATVSAQVHKAVSSFLAANPGSNVYWTGGQVTTMYGKAFSTGQTAQASVDRFLDTHAGMLGVPREQLVPGSLAADNAAVREIMPDYETDRLKFQLISYTQQIDGYPVYRSDVRLLVRNEPGNPLVLVRNGLKELGRFRVDQIAADNPNLAAAFDQAELRVPGITDWGTPELVIWAGYGPQQVEPKLAIKFIVTAGDPWTPGYARWLFLADARTGQIVHGENQIVHVDVSGNVSGIATPGKAADTCATEVSTPMPYARVAIGATVAFADVNGNFTIPNAGSSAVTVNAGMRGRWFRVFNPTADAPGLTLNVTPPGPANFVFNAANTDANRRAEANAYYQSNVVRDHLLTHAPTFPTIPTQSEFRINTAVSGTCNAFYDGSSINFYNAGGGCANTAFGDVVHHEYGHHIVNVAGSGQGAYGEGFGDLMGVIISDEPRLGIGFQTCANGIRTASNTLQYPCDAGSNGIHFCGQLLSGSFWETRNELVITKPSTYRTIISRLATNSVLLHSGGDTSIDPQITIDVLTLDDDNADIGDGTPNYNEIAAGFGEKNLDAPPIQPLSFTYPAGRPAFISPSGEVEFTVQVGAISATPQPNTGILHVDPENDGTYVQYPMTQTSANVYEAAFPATDCGSLVRYYVSAKTTSNTTVFNPTNAPAGYYTAISGAAVTTAFEDNFQTNKGWATSATATDGQWGRGVPINCSRGDPNADFDGSGQCYLTDNDAANSCNSDVDGGSVTLTSPTFDATGGETYVSYARWYSNNFGADPNNDVFVVEVSNNNGASWVNLETVGPVADSNGGWVAKAFKLSSKIALTSQMRVRFVAADAGAGSVIEAGVDAFKVEVVTGCGSCAADFDGSGFVDSDDFDAFVTAYEAGDISADFDGTGFVDGDDYDAFVVAFEQGC